jgi:phage tail-like protein
MDGAIVVVDRKNNDTVLARWEFTDAWPTKYTAPDFNATGSDVAVETLELAHEGLKRVS